MRRTTMVLSVALIAYCVSCENGNTGEIMSECTVSSSCDEGLVCRNKGVQDWKIGYLKFCLEPGKEGEACEGDYDCEDGLNCVDMERDNEFAESPLEAILGRCCSSGSEGSYCEPFSEDADCEEGLVCSYYWREDVGGPARCMEEHSLSKGSYCAEDIECVEGTECRFFGRCDERFNWGWEYYRCQEKSASTEECCINSDCADGLVCINFLEEWPFCGPSRTQGYGEPCTDHLNCEAPLICNQAFEWNGKVWENWLVASTCRNPSKLREPCVIQGDCVDGLNCARDVYRCTDGKEGSPCGGHGDCTQEGLFCLNDVCSPMD